LLQSAQDEQQAGLIKASFQAQMGNCTPLECTITAGRDLVESHPLRTDLMMELALSLESPTREASRVFLNGVKRADGLIVWKKKDTGEFLTFQWITDTYTDREATSFLLEQRRVIPAENRGDKRRAVLSRLRNCIE
jgi:hypothetical protein